MIPIEGQWYHIVVPFFNAPYEVDYGRYNGVRDGTSSYLFHCNEGDLWWTEEDLVFHNWADAENCRRGTLLGKEED
jgi:hypothetical protein